MRVVLPSGTPGELVLPATGTPTRGLVLWPDIMGLRPLFVDHAQRLADDNGWSVCVVDPFGGASLTLEERFAAMGSLVDDDKVADAEAAADACGVGPVGVLGFCMGGMYAMKSLASTRFDRAVAFYGMVRLPDDWRGPDQRDAIETVRARAASPVGLSLLCLFGTEDPYCPLDQIDEVEAAGATVVRYPGADHGWAQDSSRPNYRPDDAADAWRRAQVFLS